MPYNDNDQVVSRREAFAAVLLCLFWSHTRVSHGIFQDGIVNVMVRLLLLRQSVVPDLACQDNVIYSTIVRHSGWISSVLIAVAVAVNSNHKIAQTAAIITALEAISTDLLGLFSVQNAPHVFFCGNFGVLLLHKAWSSDAGSSTTLDILSTMVRVTSMRGAQSGGVVTFQPDKHGLKGIRSRVNEMSISARVILPSFPVILDSPHPPRHRLRVHIHSNGLERKCAVSSQWTWSIIKGTSMYLSALV